MPNTREKLIELIREHQCIRNPFDGECDNNCDACHADHLIAHGVMVQEWISVKDRLPENKSCILMYSTDGGVAEGIYDTEHKRWIQFRWSVLNVPSVTHWMPLPQPPRGE